MKYAGIFVLFTAGVVSGWVVKDALSDGPLSSGSGDEQSMHGAGSDGAERSSHSTNGDGDRVDSQGGATHSSIEQILGELYDDEYALEDIPGMESMSEAELRDLISERPNSPKAISRVMSVLFARDMSAGFRFIEDTRDPEMQRRLVLYGIGAAASMDPKVSFDWVTGNTTGSTYDQSMSTVIAAMAIVDPSEAAVYLGTLPYGKAFEMSMMRLSKVWAQQDPHAALEWLNAQPGGPEQEHSLRAAYMTMAREHTASALNLALNMAEGKDRTNLLHSIAAAKARQDPYEAMEWALNLDDPNADAYLSTAERAWIDNDPWKALEYYNSNPDMLNVKNSSILTRTLSRRDPQAAANWIETLPPEGPEYNKAIEVLFDNWVDHDPMKASLWASNLPEGKARDSAAEEIAGGLRREDPASAYLWAASIGDVKSRKSEVKSVLETWYRTDPGGAVDAVLSGDLPEEERNSYLILLGNKMKIPGEASSDPKKKMKKKAKGK